MMYPCLEIRFIVFFRTHEICLHKNNSPGSPDKDTLLTGSCYIICGIYWPSDDLRCHPVGSSHHCIPLVTVGGDLCTEAKICEFDFTCHAQQHVVRLDVSVDDLTFVKELQCLHKYSKNYIIMWSELISRWLEWGWGWKWRIAAINPKELLKKLN